MKLRNKKTGEIEPTASVAVGCKWYKSLDELNEEWEDAPEEEWRDVLGFEELYQVSNLGNVRTVKRGEATVMSQKEHWNGYLSVHLRNKGVERRASVHRLVAEAFIPNPDGLRDVNHKNGIKTDNRVENLEWLSHSDNIKHAYQMKEPKEPLIKDEKIRKAVRAWAEVDGIYAVEIVSKYQLISLDEQCSIEFFKEIYPDYVHNEEHTIAELCGEDGE